MNVSIYMKGDYEEFHALRRQENKAKQSQIAAFGRKSEALHKDSLGRNPKCRRGMKLKATSKFPATGG